MKDLTAKDLERKFSYLQLLKYNGEIRSQFNALKLEYTRLKKQQQEEIENQVELRTKQLTEELTEKDKQIEALKATIAKMQSQMNNDSTNSGLPTSKTAIGKAKYIPNTREKSGKKKAEKLGCFSVF